MTRAAPLHISTKKDMAVQYLPIGRDYLLSLGSSPRNFVVKLESESIYTGRAFARPGATAPLVRMNDIAAPYLGQEADCLTTESDEYNAVAGLMRTFKVYDAGGAQIGNDLAFYLKWENDTRGVLGRNWPHEPITGRVISSQPFIVSLYNADNLTYDGGSGTYIRIKGDTWATASNVIAYAGVGNYTFQLGIYLNGTEKEFITLNGHRYDLVPSCKVRYIVYYVNGYGAWDSLLIEGAAIEGRSWDRKELRREYRNNVESDRGRWNYANVGERTWELHTGWISDEAATRMHHLLGSTLVYLFDTQGSVFIPVVVTDAEWRQQTFAANGGPVDYTVHLSEAREVVRR